MMRNGWKRGYTMEIALEASIAWMEQLLKFGIKPGLERMKWVLQQLGHPERRLKFIHIAGTNGKGSTVAALTSVLREAGYHVGTFTSPEMEGFLDRIQYDGENIAGDAVVSLVQEIRPIVEKLENSQWGPMTEFEVLTVLAILYFAKVTYPDFVVWETGLGGRLDSTNVVIPLISAITNVGYDHMHILGENLEEIAKEKAGIIKNGVPVVTTADDPKVIQILSDVAVEKKSTLYRVNHEFSVSQKDLGHLEETERFSFQGPFKNYENLTTSLIGAHQVQNAGLAVMVLEILRQYYGIYFEEEQIRLGLAKVTWPGRFEIIQKDPCLILDGAHNVNGVEALVKTVKERFGQKKLIILFSVFRDKDVAGIIQRIAVICKEVIVTEMNHPRSAGVDEMAELFHKANPNLPVKKTSDLDLALSVFNKNRGPEDLLLVTGSLHFISEVRKKLGKVNA
jgi:dihydrofolate synthase / folylpolyglutamate synthase